MRKTTKQQNENKNKKQKNEKLEKIKNWIGNGNWIGKTTKQQNENWKMKNKKSKPKIFCEKLQPEQKPKKTKTQLVAKNATTNCKNVTLLLKNCLL